MKGGKPPAMSPQDIIEFIFFPVVNEGCRVVAEGIVDKPADLDVATVLAMGFPPFRCETHHASLYSSRTILSRPSVRHAITLAMCAFCFCGLVWCGWPYPNPQREVELAWTSIINETLQHRGTVSACAGRRLGQDTALIEHAVDRCASA